MTDIRLGLLASHNGTTIQAILDAVSGRRLDVEPAVVISNNSQSGAIVRARDNGVPAIHISGRTHPDTREEDSALCQALADHGVDLVFLAGYMKRLGPLTLARFRGQILNTHPARLPKFGGKGMYGSRVHEAVLASGDRTTGVSIHIVDADYDTGQVIARREVAVMADDNPETLAARVREREREFVVETIQAIAMGRINLPGYSHGGRGRRLHDDPPRASTVTIADYDRRWTMLFDQEKTRLARIIPESMIEHIGSTSVAGLAAKPVVDIMLGVDQLPRIERALPQLEASGYEYVPEYEVYLPERRYFRGSVEGTRTHLHGVELQGDFWIRHLAFRDYLRRTPQRATEYANLKRRLAEQYRTDSMGYTEAKSEFIESCLKHAGGVSEEAE